MKKLLSYFLFTFLFLPITEAQVTRYLVKLKNKGGNPFSISNPSTYLSQRAIDRRTRYGISIDSTDLPPTPAYITQIRNVPNVTILNISKWLNSVSIQTNDPTALNTINGFPFVETVIGIAARFSGESPIRDKFPQQITDIITQERPDQVEADYYNYGTNAYNEIHLHKAEFLHNIGLRGQGMMITLHDAGFFNYTTLDAFDSVNMNGQVLSTWDFVTGNASVTEDNSHGMQVFSTIAANIPGQFVGKAPKANFHLFRTEDVASENVIEEHNWVCAAERADSLGTDLISSSLGYTTFDIPAFNHPYADRNGNIAMITIGADLAAKKGILVFNAQGNIIDPETHFLSVPADGDSVVSVGSVNQMGIVASNSSYGPSSDGQVKPDVASVGQGAVVQTSANTIGTSNGTSFACPNMAGMTACLWQGFPEYNNMKIVNAIRRAGSRFSTPDDRMGYGIPDMKAAFSELLVEYATSSATINACTARVNWSSKDVGAMKYEIERRLPGESSFTKVGELNPTAGVILTNRTYQFDNAVLSPTAGTIFYRIRQIIDTSTASFSASYIDTTSVTIASGCFATGNPDPSPIQVLVRVQPNPSTGSQATLVVESPFAITNMPVAIYDGNGKLMMQWKQSKTMGRASFDLPAGKLAAGKYYIRVYNNDQLLGTAEWIRL